MVYAGDLVRASDHVRVGEATATSTLTLTTATTEQVVDTVVASLVAVGEYEINYYGIFGSSVGDGTILVRLREDSLTGTQRVDNRVTVGVANKHYACPLRARYTAAATGLKTLVVTAVRESGTGNAARGAAATSPSLLTVDQVHL